MTTLSYQLIVTQTESTKAFTAQYHQDIKDELAKLRTKLEYMYGVVVNELGLSFRERTASTNYIGVLCNEIMVFELEAFKMFQWEVQQFYNDGFFNSDDYNDKDSEDPLDQLFIYVVKEFYQQHPHLLIVSIVPVDMSGTFGFVVIPKDMNPLATGTV